MITATQTKPILDPCCGSRMFYFDKQNPLVDYRDNRELETNLCDGRPLVVKPDTIGSVTDIDAPDNSFHLVIFDPPHLSAAGKTGWQAQKYGSLPKDWQSWMKQAWAECWRVLATNGTLIFKWYEYRVPLKEVLACAPAEPICGNKRPTNSKTHWLVFFKEGGK